MYDEKETRRLYLRALKQYVTSNLSKEENADARKTRGLLKEAEDPIKTSVVILCNALASYLKSLKLIERLMISDPLFLGFDGSNPLLVALNKKLVSRWRPKVRYAAMMFQSGVTLEWTGKIR